MIKICSTECFPNTRLRSCKTVKTKFLCCAWPAEHTPSSLAELSLEIIGVVEE